MPDTLALPEYRLTDHVRLEMERRGIAEADIAQVLTDPEQVETARLGRRIYQSRLAWGSPARNYLLRVIVDIDRQPPAVVTAYRTSKIEKYWRLEP